MKKRLPLSLRLVIIVSVGFTMLLFHSLRAEEARPNTFADKEKARLSAARANASQGDLSVSLRNLVQNLQSLKSKTQQVAQIKSIPLSVPTEQRSAWIELERMAKGPVRISWSMDRSQPVFIQAQDLLADESKSESVVRLSEIFVSRSKKLFGLASEDARLEVAQVNVDDLGMKHVRMHQTYANIPVYGSDMYFHFDAYKQLAAVNGRLTPVSGKLDVKPSVLAKQAEKIALQELQIPDDSKVLVSSQQIIYPDEDKVLHLSYQVNVVPNLAENWQVFVDAHTGKVLHKLNTVCFDGPVSGSGQDLSGQTRTFGAYQIGNDYYLIDTSKPMFDAAKSKFPDEVVGGIVLLDAKNQDGKQLYFVTSQSANSWNAPNAISAIYYGGIVYDYYKNVHNRNSIDSKGGTMFMIVNFKSGYNNAFWNGKFMVFGNGDNNQFSDLAGALDVTAHEMTHGVVEHTANLVYENQSGALNESFADVFGVSVEFYHEGNAGDWLVGEDVTTPGTAGDALRDMADPGGPKVGGGAQPAHMNQYQNLPNTPDGDNGGVHVNSGIPNKAFYLASQAIGVNKTEKIYYRALANYLTRSAQFIDARLALVKAAGDLYGDNSAEQTAIKNAFDQVGIGDGTGTPPPPVEPRVEGQEWVLAVDSATRGLYRVSPDAQRIELITASPVLSKPSVSDDGSFILFVDTSYNPHLVSFDGSSDQVLDTNGLFWNISISPNGKMLAATSNNLDGKIYVVNLDNPDAVVEHQLYSQTYTQGEKASTVWFADALEWTLDGQYVLYDAYNVSVTATGDTLSYWDINVLRANDGTIIRIFPPQPPGVNVGNPVLASNNDYIIAFDYQDENGFVTVLGANLETGDIGQITTNGTALARPDFSPDDRWIIYQYTDGINYGVYFTGLLQDGITGTGSSQIFLTGAIYPIWLTVGERPETGVQPKQVSAVIPDELQLAQNYPNPFNPETQIRFTLPQATHVKLTVYDVRGREVAVLADEKFAAGSHKVNFNAANLPSGVYVYSLQAGNAAKTRKMILVK